MKAAREKNWNELGIEEKVERLRLALRVANEKANQAGRTANEAYQIAHMHEHGGKGQVVMDVSATQRNHPLMFIGGGKREDRDYVDGLLA